MIWYMCVFVCSASISAALTPCMIALGRKWGIVDEPNVRKIHNKPIPRLGGIAIYVSMIVSCLVFLGLYYSFQTFSWDARLLLVLVAGTIVFVTGLVDDIRTLRASYKFMFQLVAAILVCSAGVRIGRVDILEGVHIQLGWLSWPLTVLWISGVTNAINLADGLDGLATGLVAIACGALAVLAGFFHLPAVLILVVALWGSVTAFLFFNAHPARIFLGDCGSLLLGFMVASLSVVCMADSGQLVSCVIPVVVLAIPILDTAACMLRRLAERRSMFSSDRQHFHHCLLDRGMSQPRAAAVIFSITLGMVIAGLSMFFFEISVGIGMCLCAMATVLVIFHKVGAFRFSCVIRGLNDRLHIARRNRLHGRDFDELDTLFRHAVTFHEWWDRVCLAAMRMGFAGVSLRVTHENSKPDIYSWRRSSNCTGEDRFVGVTIPIQKNAAQQASLCVMVAAGQSLEATGHRFTLFARLLENYGPPELPRGLDAERLEQEKEVAATCA